ncbi:hypothetical protein [Streptomyces sp. NPDC001933]|uniref:hypothetical protein n=1 Tax=Streptomyces sp. NPDC001933 TaxID=3364626 RepID=UPI0036777631
MNLDALNEQLRSAVLSRLPAEAQASYTRSAKRYPVSTVSWTHPPTGTAGRWIATKPSGTGYRQQHLELYQLPLVGAVRVLNAVLPGAIPEQTSFNGMGATAPLGAAAQYLVHRVHRSLYPAGERGDAGAEWTSGLCADWFGPTTVTITLTGVGLNATAALRIHTSSYLLELAVEAYAEALPCAEAYAAMTSRADST